MTETWTANEREAGGARQVRFSLTVDGERVPGLLVLPRGAGPFPLVFIQHPGTSSKDDFFVAGTARDWLRHGWACVGIDAPMHGDRDGADPMALFRDADRFPAIRAQFAKEVSAVVDAIAGRYPVDLARLGWASYSMGSMLGIEAVARDGRFKAAVFAAVGEGGLAGPSSGPESVVPELEGVAVRLVGKEADELIARDATERLFEAIPGEKDLVWLPGGHFSIGADVVQSLEGWLLEQL
ncbi:MAG: hypothetical protein Kow0010_06490 [Dehalococcoidia bacterium]